MVMRHRNSENGGGWTLDTLQEHNQICDALKKELMEERDRRYSEVNIEREKALKIKEEADKAALGLAREIQSYKDEKANQLREQISSERGTYASKDDLAASMREITALIAPLSAYVSAVGGGEKKVGLQQDSLRGTTNVLVVIVAAAALFLSVAMPFIVRG